MIKAALLVLRLTLVLVSLAYCADRTIAANADPHEHVGVARVQIDHEFIKFPPGVVGFAFDTTADRSSEGGDPWMFLGDIKVDSLIFADSSSYLREAAQLDRAAIEIGELTSFFKASGVRQFMRRIPKAIPNDTSYYDPIRQQMRYYGDLSEHYRIVFDSKRDMGVVKTALEKIPNLVSSGGIPIRYPDACVPGVDEWIPNDTFVNYMIGYPAAGLAWHLTQRPDESASGGANVFCAWGDLPQGQRGNVNIALLDNRAREDHEDLNVTNYTINPNPGSHGTKVAGIAAAISNNTVGVAGVAPDAKIFVYNLQLDTLMEGTNDALNIFEAVNNKIDTMWVILMPWSFPSEDTDPLLYYAIDYAYDHSRICITSSGNMAGPAYVPFIGWPQAWSDCCISVGAHMGDGDRWVGSNYTCDTCPPMVTVVAPGVSIRTTDYSCDACYTTSTGTSASLPVVGGMAALAKSVVSDITPDVVKELLEQSADQTDLNYPADEKYYGAGRVDAGKFMSMVRNWALDRDRLRTATSVNDSIPCIIITSSGLESYFEPLADRKTRRGTNTAILTTSSIYSSYSGADNQEKIRACIADHYDNKHLEYVLLGGDGTIVPYRYAYNNLYGPGVSGISDFYYACLDGDWNYDSDTLWGETEDSLDLEPEVAVGRLPFSSSTDVTNFIDKLVDYESGSPSSWQTKVLSVGSQMFNPNDGQEMGDALLDYFPQGFSQSVLYDTASGSTSLAAYFTAMNAGQGVVIKHGPSWNQGGPFFLGREHGWIVLYKENIDTLSNTGMPAVVYSVTCWGQQFDEDCLAEHYIKVSDGGAIAYIGATHNDYGHVSSAVSAEFFDQLFGSGPKEIGKLLNVAKETMLSSAERWDGPYRHTMFGYALSGDPQMRIWTATPQTLADSTAQTLYRGSNTFTVKVTSGGQAVEDALVCIKQGASAYEIAETNGSGIASFTSVVFDHSSIATVAATKHNYVAVEDTIDVLCCLSRVGDANCMGGDEPTIGDLMVMIDAKFISGTCDGIIACLAEADINLSGGADPTCLDITISDIAILQDYLFGSDPPPLNDCY